MGVACEINLFKPADGAYRPGEVVSGVIKYAVDEDTVFDKIIVSLKGMGFLVLKDKQRRRKHNLHTYRNGETFIDVDDVVQDNQKGATLYVGSYETKFSFKLPHNIPASMTFSRNTARYIIRSNITYYIRIKFERPGFMKTAKHFKRGITVVTGIVPRLPTEPTIFGEQKKLTQLFSSRTNIINIKATIESCVITPGEKVKFNYEIFNDSNIIVKSVEAKIVEAYTFTTKGCRRVTVEEDVPDTETKTGSIGAGDTQTNELEINMPSDRDSLENTCFISRDYLVHITVALPMPHRNAVLNIPLQVGYRLEENVEVSNEPPLGPPPSYWETMGEESKDDEDKLDGDDEDD